ncbi:hypothetical protein TNCV_3194061 [Trichonephila clavipes]|uniref:Uncharacterized protein n=1 Tax=Trichonephila clavipes TaxID=2585209 RepID=A0A8X6V0T0_TRICX|nr:hypothetical protein TNCV_3194061 [Trichonephila clavipes]
MYKNALKEDLIRVIEELDGIVESTDTIVKLKTKIENSSTFESDPDFVKTLIQNCIDERVSQNEREVLPLVSMEIPQRTAYGQNGRCGMQPKAKHSLRAQAQLMRTETVETFELVKVKQKLLDIRERERKGERERCASRRYLLHIIVKLIYLFN